MRQQVAFNMNIDHTEVVKMTDNGQDIKTPLWVVIPSSFALQLCDLADIQYPGDLNYQDSVYI